MGLVEDTIPLPIRRRFRADVVVPVRALTGLRGPLPSFLILGASKSGTSSLFDYLMQHPRIVEPLFKEVHYFDVHHARGLRWYRACFPRQAAGPGEPGAGTLRPITGEASPYYLFHPAVPERVAQDLGPGRVKLVALLRNPVDRAYSQWNHETRKGNETLGFAEAIEAEDARLAGEEERLLADPTYHGENHRWFSYRSRGLYADQLERWFARFPRTDLLVLPSERFFEDTGAVLAEVFEHLGVPPVEVPHERNKNPGGYAPDRDREARDALAAWFEPHNARLFELLGERFDW